MSDALKKLHSLPRITTPDADARADMVDVQFKKSRHLGSNDKLSSRRLAVHLLAQDRVPDMRFDKTISVPIAKVRASQHGVERSNVASMLEKGIGPSDKPRWGIITGGAFELMDGHHRGAAEHLKGATHITSKAIIAPRVSAYEAQLARLLTMARGKVVDRGMLNGSNYVTKAMELQARSDVRASPSASSSPRREFRAEILKRGYAYDLRNEPVPKKPSLMRMAMSPTQSKRDLAAISASRARVFAADTIGRANNLQLDGVHSPQGRQLLKIASQGNAVSNRLLSSGGADLHRYDRIVGQARKAVAMRGGAAGLVIGAAALAVSWMRTNPSGSVTEVKRSSFWR